MCQRSLSMMSSVDFSPVMGSLGVPLPAPGEEGVTTAVEGLAVSRLDVRSMEMGYDEPASAGPLLGVERSDRESVVC